ncbi:MAG: hypothetical protein DU429_04485 [Candidatus Tokpelaia sp.]|uniref:hypothetical protein n=1 Tax=Candidatus Tokpelaia sp. TaxID=2233777 RepID=UPI001239897E|nr:hypothetical protein [Candidatus Tokpelaia sp.]KAA6204919.1 MAG: hypothetical protein DU430_05900 [Candidatus Tokpelaia sp.]KAA6207102.1 MAG: hypothetical protein DU429_04485 [Candidatus Tokpelaia sp.]KAA6405360.1 hypothetical protein DPQ22_04670 [Candidatus Tokpelaia sp.]
MEKRDKTLPERVTAHKIPEELSKIISPLPKEKQKKIVTALQKIEMSRFFRLCRRRKCCTAMRK